YLLKRIGKGETLNKLQVSLGRLQVTFSDYLQISVDKMIRLAMTTRFDHRCHLLVTGSVVFFTRNKPQV
ncbi:MAG: hypothetical protein L0K39_12090, partial [Enterobacterales bacterium]|nr:hypothetical protein [Enterobacterales bacterium]